MYIDGHNFIEKDFTNYNKIRISRILTNFTNCLSLELIDDAVMCQRWGAEVHQYAKFKLIRIWTNYNKLRISRIWTNYTN